MVCIEDLVELKKTNRPADYESITKLALIRLGREGAPNGKVLRWSLENVFVAEDLWKLVSRWGRLVGPRIRAGLPAVKLFHAIWKRGKYPTTAQLGLAAASLGRSAQRHQAFGRAYWLPLLVELRRMRLDGKNMVEGELVKAR